MLYVMSGHSETKHSAHIIGYFSILGLLQNVMTSRDAALLIRQNY